MRVVKRETIIIPYDSGDKFEREKSKITFH